MLLDDARETMRPDSVNRRRNTRAMRPLRISPIGLLALLYTVSLYVFYRQGLLSGQTFLGVAAVAVCAAILFGGMFRLNLNTRFAEPTLMLPQLLTALIVMLTVAYIERATQITLVPFILIAFLFGFFRLSMASLIMMAIACLSADIVIIMMHGYAEGYGNGFHVGLMQWFVLALTLPGIILAGKQIQHLQQQLKATRYQLEHYEEKSVRDELTGLYNRRQIQTELEQAKLHADTRSVPFSICIIDIDRFKEINDNHGHLAGDTILKEFARVALDSIRDTDILGRYGGDEFMQILRDTDVKGAVMHAERLRVYAHFLDFQKILAQKHISLSIGVAQYRRGEKITDLISRADSALYQAKQLGRNRVEWAEAA